MSVALHMLELVDVTPDAAGAIVTATGQIAHKCPYRDETDNGTITITWQVDDATIELHTLADYINGFADTAISHEDLTGIIARDLTKSGLRGVQVKTIWHTAGLGITVTKGDTADGAVLRQPHQPSRGA